MGAILILASCIAVFSLLYLLIKRRPLREYLSVGKRKAGFMVLVCLAVLLLSVTAWFFTPYEADLPETYEIQTSSDVRLGWLDSADAEALMSLLRQTRLRRELVTYGSTFDRPVQADDVVYLYIYDAKYPSHKSLAGSYALVISDLGLSRFVPFASPWNSHILGLEEQFHNIWNILQPYLS